MKKLTFVGLVVILNLFSFRIADSSTNYDDNIIAAGFYHTLALKDDGTVWAWGGNEFGQLGDETTIDKYVPVQVHSLNNVRSVSCGTYHSLALKHDGTVWEWGSYGYGVGFELKILKTPIQVTKEY